ncbi:MAG: hypothetical protein HPY83_01915 [Anaerolineae bacterium]|nr:hypothetical protein [Anaerolineae bacterium]
MSSSSRVLKQVLPAQPDWRIIRHGGGDDPDDGGTTGDVMALDCLREEARRQAEALVAQARSEAAHILTQAQEEAARIMEKAAQEGRREGLVAGLDEGRRQGEDQALEANRARAERLAELAKAVQEEQLRIVAELEPQLVELALGIARKVIGAELATRPELLLEILARAIEQARGGGRCHIRLHPDDVDLVEPHLPQSALEAGGSQWRLVADPSLSPGDCLIETDFGVVDARISTQLDELRRLMLGSSDGGHAH